METIESNESELTLEQFKNDREALKKCIFNSIQSFEQKYNVTIEFINTDHVIDSLGQKSLSTIQLDINI